MILSKAISTRIRQILKDRQMTQYRLEQMTGINHNTMTNLLNNRYRACNIRTVVIIIMAYCHMSKALTILGTDRGRMAMAYGTGIDIRLT